MVEYCTVFIAKMQEKPPTPTQNVQRVKAELRNIDPSVKFITRSGMVTQGSTEEGLNMKRGQETMALADQELAQRITAVISP